MKELTGAELIHRTAVVEDGAMIGARTSIWHFAHVRAGAKIGDDCNIGKDVYVDNEALVGCRVKIQNGASIYRGVMLMDDVFIGPGVVFTNDLSPRATGKYWFCKTTLVRQGASIGANATILCGTDIGRYAMIGAGSVVTRDVPAHALVRGNPGRVVGYVCTNGHTMDETRGGYVCTLCKESLQMDAVLRQE